jgi:tetratricopeptide (TPR) repeat protein
MAEKIISDFPLEGYIVQRDGDTVLIDLGKRAGVKPGMQFMVYKEGRVIKHPKTGEVLDIERIETGTIEISDVKTKTADARIVKEIEANAISTSQLVKSNIELEPPRETRKREREQPAVYGSDEGAGSQLAAIDGQIEELRQLKMSNNSAWKNKFREIDRGLDILEKRHRRDPEVYLSRAKMMEAIDKMEHAQKYIHKALSVRRHYPHAYALKGDLYVWDTTKPKPVYNRNKALKLALDGYEDAAKYAGDVDFQADIYLKMGNAHAELGNIDKAKDFWQKTIAAAPSSNAARSAREKAGL